MPEIYNRVHAAGQALWLSVVPLLVAQLTLGDGAIAAKTLLLSAFLLLTTPVAAHAMARAAFRRDMKPEEPRNADVTPPGSNRRYGWRWCWAQQHFSPFVYGPATPDPTP